MAKAPYIHLKTFGLNSQQIFAKIKISALFLIIGQLHYRVIKKILHYFLNILYFNYNTTVIITGIHLSIKSDINAENVTFHSMLKIDAFISANTKEV